MTKHALRFTRLEIRRMPGIQNGYTLDVFSPGINLIFGPNATGKTTTARAIETVVWPDAERDPSVIVCGDYQIDDATFRVDIDAGHVSVQRDGQPLSPPQSGLPAPELRHRYRLSLHDLLLDNGQDFAERVRRESSGGYDLSTALNALETREKPSRTAMQTEALLIAKEEAYKARQLQADLQREEETIKELVHQQRAASAAAHQGRVLEMAIRCGKSANTLNQTKTILSSFSPTLAHLRGNEAAQLERLTERKAELLQRLAECDRELSAASSVIETTFPNLEPTTGTLTTLGADCEQLKVIDQQLCDIERRRNAAHAALNESRRVLGGEVGEEQLERIDTVTFDELSRLANDFETLRGQVVAATETLHIIGEVAPVDEVDRLRTGVHLLTHWLSVSNGPSERERRLTVALWIVTALAAIVAIALGIAVDFGSSIELALAAGVLFGAVVLTLWASRRVAGESDRRHVYEQDYQRLGYEQPAEWTRDAVLQRVESLQQQAAHNAVEGEKLRWRQQILARQKSLEAPHKALEDTRQSVAARLGVAPDTDAYKLSWLADRIARWQDARQMLASAQAEFETLRIRRAEQLEHIHSVLGLYGYPEPNTVAEVVGYIHDLQKRVQIVSEARQAGEHARIQREQLEHDIAQVDDEHNALLVVGGEILTESQLHGLLAEHERFSEARQQHSRAEAQHTGLLGEYQTIDGFDPDLLQKNVVDLEKTLEQVVTKAATLQELTERITEIRTRVEEAKNGHAIADAQDRVATAEAALHQLRSENVRAVVGYKLAQYIQQVAHDQQLPEVFHRARELFLRITGGRYRLDLSSDTHPQFRAYDTTTGIGQSLDELSSASRVQLLFAVRLAFVESEEQQVALPILLDETLGTSDDARALAIIDAVITLVKTGRQVFYFTAQPDELGKWITRLQQLGIAHQLIDLAKTRRMSDKLPDGALSIAPVTIGSFPPPNGCSHAEYGATIHVPRIRVGFDNVGATPLWYLIEDPETLYHLSTLGVTTWGALEALVSCGGESVMRSIGDQYPKCAALVRALTTLHTQTAIGRGRTVDRGVLQASGAISDTMIDRVVELAKRYNGDARPLMAAIEKNEILRLRKKVRGKLRQFLEREGYLDEREPLTTGQIQIAMMASVTSDIAAGILTPNDVWCLWRRVYPNAETPNSSLIALPMSANMADMAS